MPETDPRENKGEKEQKGRTWRKRGWKGNKEKRRERDGCHFALWLINALLLASLV